MYFRKLGLAISAIAVLCSVSLASADEVEEALQFALEAYQAGDFKTAREEVDFAGQLLKQMKAAELADYLPEAMDGWTRRISNDASGAAFGASTASAIYSLDSDQSQMVSVEFMADGQVVTSMAVMFSNPAALGAMGTVKRIGRQKAVVTNEGDVQAMIDSRIMVQVGGTAPGEAREAYFAAIDFRSLADF